MLVEAFSELSVKKKFECTRDTRDVDVYVHTASYGVDTRTLRASMKKFS